MTQILKRQALPKFSRILMLLAATIGLIVAMPPRRAAASDSKSGELAGVTVVSASVWWIFEPLSEAQLRHLERAAQSKEYARELPQIAMFLYRYQRPRGKPLLVKMLNRGNLMAATLLAGERDRALLPAILKVFLGQRSYAVWLTRSLANWPDARVLRALRLAYTREPGNGELALALARQEDGALAATMDRQLRHAPGDAATHLEISVALSKLAPAKYLNLRKSLLIQLQSLRSVNGVAPASILRAAARAKDMAYRPTVLALLARFAGTSLAQAQSENRWLALHNVMGACATYLEQSPRPGDVTALASVLPRLKALKMKMVQGVEADFADAVLGIDPLGGPILLGPYTNGPWLLRAMGRQHLIAVPEEYLVLDVKLGELLERGSR